jgi:hypothetical protein
MTYSIKDLLDIQGTDHICKVQMKRKPEIETKYSIYRKTFNFEKFKKILFNNANPWKVYLNDFPYDIPDNMHHILVWFNSPDRNMELASKIIKNYFSDEVIWFANTPELMSIGQLFHIHIFIKK